MIVAKTPDQVDKMAEAGDILVRTLKMLKKSARPGVTTMDLDLAAEKFIRSQGAEAAFKGYNGFPGSICASPNSMVVHGIPGSYELKRGDLISLDVGVTLDGWVADAAFTIPIGPVDEPAPRAARDDEGLALLRHRGGQGGQPPRRHLPRHPGAGRT